MPSDSLCKPHHQKKLRERRLTLDERRLKHCLLDSANLEQLKQLQLAMFIVVGCKLRSTGCCKDVAVYRANNWTGQAVPKVQIGRAATGVLEAHFFPQKTAEFYFFEIVLQRKRKSIAKFESGRAKRMDGGRR